MDYQTLNIEKEGGIDWVTLNRPDSLNALNPAMVDELLDYFQSLYMDHSVRVVVLKGAGKAFCAGLDLKERSNAPDASRSGPAAGLVSQRRISEIVMRMRRCPQAIVSLVHGPACGGGFALALASDIRIAGESARMNAAFIRLGLSACDIGVSYFLPRLVGVSVASELMMTGRFINAERALRVGLVSEVVPDGDLVAAARPYLDEMLTTSPLGLRLTKECLNMSVDAGSLHAAIAMEDRNQILCAQTSDFREGISAFLGKRKPAYTDS
ncbi:MAG: enoyl-CoA hydratase/isomerase family protein [Parvibaculaceae bacterium]|nr:enoyl-CoA hydratase/isomerase family protein [Parvibaculaceae bacterium]